MLQELIDIVLGKNKMLFFHSQFLNMDISVNITYRPFRFETCILEIQMEGSVSQNVDIDPSFFFVKCRNNVPKVTRFFT